MQCQREMDTTTMATDFGSSSLVVDLAEGGEASVEDMVVVDSEAEEEAAVEVEEDAVDPRQDGRITDVWFQVKLNIVGPHNFLFTITLQRSVAKHSAAVGLNYPK